MKDLMKALNENAVMQLWPDVGTLLGMKRGATYSAAKRGEIKTVKFGHFKRVPTAWLKRKLEMIDSGDAA
jgi:hypothetical protein